MAYVTRGRNAGTGRKDEGAEKGQQQPYYNPRPKNTGSSNLLVYLWGVTVSLVALGGATFYIPEIFNEPRPDISSTFTLANIAACEKKLGHLEIGTSRTAPYRGINCEGLIFIQGNNDAAPYANGGNKATKTESGERYFFSADERTYGGNIAAQITINQLTIGRRIRSSTSEIKMLSADGTQYAEAWVVEGKIYAYPPISGGFSESGTVRVNDIGGILNFLHEVSRKITCAFKLGTGGVSFACYHPTGKMPVADLLPSDRKEVEEIAKITTNLPRLLKIPTQPNRPGADGTSQIFRRDPRGERQIL